ncbi:WXG100 family type VII secretion target [Gandjariella thermophila]|uniref:ESAT-6-like protein n=1 Tax=Gandjariella thermophila TaxID=1931992 RepID=A0A4D4J8C5_9PSEU|nr:WXG100 family type VII secretion target [Gandjariella thermophila]GDY33055.1 hypothetical protein GTS_46880 [Gandjariella thermophila]
MPDLVVDFAELQAAESTLRTTVREIDARLAYLADRLTWLTEVWQGEAAEGFREAHRRWQEAARDLQERLAELHRFLVTAHGNHATAVRTNTRIWRV